MNILGVIILLSDALQAKPTCPSSILSSCHVTRTVLISVDKEDGAHI